MSRGGGFRGRGYGPRGHHRQGPGPDLSGGSGSRGTSGTRHSGSRQEGPGPRPSRPNPHHDGPNSHQGSPNFNQRGGGPPRGPRPNFNPSRRPPRHQNQPSNNWSPRGGSPQFQNWRGAHNPRFNGPPRPFYHSRGQGGQYMPRFPFMPSGNYPPPLLQSQPLQEPKPAIPHLGSEEERQQKITEAADALKRKLSAVAKEPEEWRDDDDEGILEASQDTDHDSRIANKGIPELKHDPPELNLTINDLRDIGRVDHEHRIEQAKNSAENDPNYEFDESEVEILAHNPVKPRIEIDLYCDDNYGDYAEDESGNRTMEETGSSSLLQDTTEFHTDTFSSACDFQSFNDDCSFGVSEDCAQDASNSQNIDAATQQEISTTENVSGQENEAVSQCNVEEVNVALKMDAKCSARCEVNEADDCSGDKSEAELIFASKVQQEAISANNNADGEEFQRQVPIEVSAQRESENLNAEHDNLDDSNVNKTTTDFEGESQRADENSTESPGENWVELSNTPQSDKTRIPGLDSLYSSEIAAHISEESKSVNDVETSVNESKTEQNDVSGSAVEPAIGKKETKESWKELTSENVDKTSTQSSEAKMRDDKSRGTRHETSDARRSHNKDRAASGFSDKATSDAITANSSKSVLRERRDDGEKRTHDNRSSEASKTRSREENRKKSRDQQSKDDKSADCRSGNDSTNKKTDFRKDNEVAKTIDTSKNNSQAKVVKSTENSSRSDKKIDDRRADKQEEAINDQKNQERKRLVRNMTQAGPKSRTRAALASEVPPDFDPREPPPLPFGKSLFSKPPPSIPQTSQDVTETPHIPPAFDPRLSSSARNALLPTVPSITSAIPLAQDFNINQAYPARNINSFPPINYGPRPIIPPINVAATANIQPICIGDPYTTLLPLPNVPIATPIAIPPDSSRLLPPLPVAPPPPLSSARKANIDIDDGLEDMQEAMEFAKQLMNMDEPPGNAEEANSIDSDFFHMPTFPDLPPIEFPPFLPSDIPTPPEVEKGSSNRQTKNKEAKKSRSFKQESDSFGPKSLPEESRKNDDFAAETGEEKMELAGEERPKVMFNLSSKNKVISKDNEWSQQQNRDDAAEAAAAINRFSASSPAISRFSSPTPVPALELTKMGLINGQEVQNVTEKNDSKTNHSKNVSEKVEAKSSRFDSNNSKNVSEKVEAKSSRFDSNNSKNVSEKIEAKSSRFDSNNSKNVCEKVEAKSSRFDSNNPQPKKSEEPHKSHSRSRSPSPGKSKQTKQTSTADSSKSETLPRKITKESVRKSTEETPESSWKSRVIGRFLKMSKNDICNMLNNTGLRKFDIAMKHLVKERTSTLSFNMRKKEEEKLKDPEASYNREEFMDQLSAMLDPSATVDVCNLPTQFLHHLSEVLQLESMSEFGAPFTPLENVEATTSSPTQQTQPRLSRENASAKEIDDRRSTKRGREKKSMETSVVTPSASATEVRKSSRPSDEPIVPKYAPKTSNTAEEVRKSSRTSEESIVPKYAPKTSNTAEEVRKSSRPSEESIIPKYAPKTSNTAEEVRKSSQPFEESIIPKYAPKTSGTAEELQKIPTLDAIRMRRRLQRQAMPEHSETSANSLNGSTSRESTNSLNMSVLDDLFTEGIAKAKKKIVQPSKSDKNTGSSETEVFPASNQAERPSQLAKDPSVERVERTAVELDKIFTAGIAKAKLASRQAAAAAARAAEANDGDDDEDDAGWRYNENRSNTHSHRGKHRSFSRHLGKSEKWNRRKAREDPDGFRNLTREEWEAKYGEISDSTYEREYRAMVAMNARKSGHSPTNYREDHEAAGEELSGGVNVMSRLGNIVASGSGLRRSWSEGEEDRRLRNDFDNADYQIESYNNSSEDESSSSSTSSTSSECSETSSPEVPSVTKLLKVIKAREKIGKKRSVNEEIRDEVNADIERKRRERGKVSRKGHKSRTKKSHRRKKDKKLRVREKKKRLRKRKKRKSRKSGSDEENSGDEDSEDEGSTSRKQGQLLTQDEIKKEMDVVVVVKDEPESEIVENTAEKQINKDNLLVTPADESSSVSLAPSVPPVANVSAATISPSQMKTKAQLKQLPPDLLTKSAAVADIFKESPKKQAPQLKELSKESTNKVVAPLVSTSSPVVSEPSSSPHSISSAVTNNPPTIIGTENLLSKSHSKKLDFNAYKERTRLRVLRENEKIRMITENPTSLTQDLLNIPLTRKKVVENIETAVSIGEISKDPRLARNLNSNISAKVSTIDTATAAANSNKISTVAKSSETSNTNSRILDICTTNVKPATSTTNTKSDVSNTNAKGSAIKITTTDKTSAIKITTTDKTSAIKITTTDKNSAIKTTTTDKNSAIKTTTTDQNSAIKTSVTDKTSAIKTSVTDKNSAIKITTTDKSSAIKTAATDKTSETAESSAINITTTKTSSDSNPTPIDSSISDTSSKIPTSENPTVQQSSKGPTRKLIRKRSLTKPPETESKLIEEARVEAGKFAHIKSEGSKEMKLREKLKKGRQRVCSEGLETTIPLVHQIRLKKRPSSLVRNAEEPTSPLAKQKIDEAPLKPKCDYFKKGIVSDLLPDIVPQEFLPEPTKITPEVDAILEQTDLDTLSLPINELSDWPLDTSISTNIDDDIDTSASPPFKGFPAEPILRRDRVLTEAELNSEIDALEAIPLAFEDGADALPMSTVVDLNDLRSTGLPLNEPISYGDEEFVQGRVEIETTLLGFSVPSDIPDDPEAIAALGDDEFVAQTVDQSLEKFTEESRESIDILPRVTSTLRDSPAPVDFLIADVPRPDSIPSPLLVTESVRDEGEESLVTDFSNNQVEEKKKNVVASCDDVAEVTSSHESNINTSGDVYLENTGPDEEMSSSRVTSNAEDKDISFGTEVINDKAEDASEAQEMQEKRSFTEDTSSKDVPLANSTLEMIHTPPPQPSSSSDSTEERGKDLAVENQRETSETRDNEPKSKESSHHSHSKSRDHLHGKSKRKSSRHHNHESKSKKKGAITEKMVKEAVVANIVKLVPKPTSKETVMARMIEIDVEIHKLMNEKMTLYKMLESGEFPVKEDAPEASAAKTNCEAKIASETEEIRETVPPTVLASRLVRDLDKTVLPTPPIVQENTKKADARKTEAVDEAKKRKQKKSPQPEMKTRSKDNANVESRRQRKISESKRNSRITTSEESSRHDTTSTHSREKSTSSTELEDAEEKNQKRRTKSLVRRSPNRRTSKRAREHSSKEDLGEGSRESSERALKSKKQETRYLPEESATTKTKKKTKNLEAKKSEEKAKTLKEEKKINVEAKVTHKNETADKKSTNDGERAVIYSDESTWDSPGPEIVQGDEHRGKKDGAPSTGLALLEESFKREMAETRKHKTMEKRKGKKQELRRILLDSATVPNDEENALKKDSSAQGKGKEKLGHKVMKHITTVIDAVAENRIEQLYNDETSSEPRDSVSDTLSIRDDVAEEKEEENVPEIVEEATKTTEVDKEEAEKHEESKAEESNDSETILQTVEEEKTGVEETKEVAEAKTTSDNEEPQETPEDNISNDENTKKSSEIDNNGEESIEKVEPEKSGEECAKQTKIDNIEETSIKTSIDVSDSKEEDREDKIEEKSSSVTVHKSESAEKQEKGIIDETTKDSSSPSPEMKVAAPEVKVDAPEKVTAPEKVAAPEVKETTPEVKITVPEVKEPSPKTPSDFDKNLQPEAEPKNQIPEKESAKESQKSLEKSSESSKERRNAKEPDADRVRSKSRNGRSAKQRSVVLRDAPSKEKKQSLVEKHNTSKVEESKEDAVRSSTRPRSATKRRQRDKSAPPSRRSSRNPDDSAKTPRSKKREKSGSRGTSPYEGEPARKKANHSRRSSSPIVQVVFNEDHSRRRGRKRKRRPELSREEMASCKVMLIDCKYTYLSPCMHPRILKKLGISRINPYTPPTKVQENSASTKLSRVETHSTPAFNKGQLTEEPEESPKEARSSPLESAKDSNSSPHERASSPSERPSSPKERSSSPRERPSSSIPKERSSSPKQPSSPLVEAPLHRVPKPIPSSPDRNPSSPKIINPSSPTEIGNRVEVDEDDDEDDVFDETIQIVKAADENIALTSQSEDEEAEGVVDVIEAPEDLPDVAEEAADVAEENAEAMDIPEEEVDVVDAAEEETDVINAAEEEVDVVNAPEEETDVVDNPEETEDVVDDAEESTPPPDSTASDIAVDCSNEENSNHENFQEADTTDEVEVLEENITIDDKPSEGHEVQESEAEEEDVEPRRTRYTVHKGPILDIKVLDDSFLAASEDGAIYRYSQQSNGILNIYKGHEAAVTCIYVMRTGKFWKLYSGSLDGTFRCYDITSGAQERQPADVGSPVQCMDQAWGVFFVGTKSGHISRYNIKSGSIKGDRLEFSDNSVLALKASSEGPRRILIVASRNQPITIRDALTGLFLRRICGYKSHTVYSLMKERNLVYCGTSSTSIPVFDFTNGEQITQYNAGVGIVCMRLYRQVLFAGCYDGNIYVFDTKETKLICSIPGPGNMLLSMEIVGDEIIAGSKNRQLHSWRMPKEVRIVLAQRT